MPSSPSPSDFNNKSLVELHCCYYQYQLQGHCLWGAKDRGGERNQRLHEALSSNSYNEHETAHLRLIHILTLKVHVHQDTLVCATCLTFSSENAMHKRRKIVYYTVLIIFRTKLGNYQRKLSIKESKILHFPNVFPPNTVTIISVLLVPLI